MKDKLDTLLENAYKEKFEPGKDLNDSILNGNSNNDKKIISYDTNIKSRDEFMKKSFMDSFTKVAVVAFCIVSIGGIGYWASSNGSSFVGKKSTKEGSTVVETTSEIAETQPLIEEKETEEEFPMYDENERAEWEELNKKYDFSNIITAKKGTNKDGWISRELDVSEDGYANVRYYYDSYQEAVEASGLGNIFTKEYKRVDEDHILCYTDIISLEGTQELLERSIYTRFEYNKGLVFLTEDYNNRHTKDLKYTDIILKKPKNERIYTSKNGYEFTLKDGGNTDDDGNAVDCTRTVIMSENRKYVITLEFRELSEEEIREVLDTVIIPDDKIDISKVPASETRDAIIKEIKKNAPKKN